MKGRQAGDQLFSSAGFKIAAGENVTLVKAGVTTQAVRVRLCQSAKEAE